MTVKMSVVVFLVMMPRTCHLYVQSVFHMVIHTFPFRTVNRKMMAF